jgi:hypothetical protein
LVFLKDRRQQFLLNVNDDEGALVGFERASRQFGVVGGGGGTFGGDDLGASGYGIRRKIRCLRDSTAGRVFGSECGRDPDRPER